MEEYRHLISRYERNMTKLILDTFSFSFLSCVMISLGFFLVFMVFVSNTISLCDILQENIEAFMIIFVSVSLLGKLFKIVKSFVKALLAYVINLILGTKSFKR